MSQNSERPGCWPIYLCLKKASAPCSSPASGGPAAPWPPRAGRSLPRRFPLPAPFWARLPVSRAQKKILPAQQAQKKKNSPCSGGVWTRCRCRCRPAAYVCHKKTSAPVALLPTYVAKHERQKCQKKTQAWLHVEAPHLPMARTKAERGREAERKS